MENGSGRQGEVQTLLSELIEHLRHSDIPGLPAEWFREQADVGACPPHASLQPSPDDEKKKDDSPSQQASSEQSWSRLETAVRNCRQCRLYETRTQTVFGVGNRRPRLVFVGEGPGAEEDRLGEPFVGKAGALLTAAIEKGMGLKRQDVYICNVVKCRPPQNRAPLPDETAACTEHLYQQLELLAPEVIVTLGAPAQQALCGVPGGITKLRGKWLEWRGIPVMPTFHPAYLLRTPEAKRPFWEDLQKVMRKLNLPLPAGRSRAST